MPNVQPPLSDGFRLGEFSDIDISEWLADVSRYGPSDPRDAKVTSISWWSSHEAPWHHQFVVITVVHDADSVTPHNYTLKFERLGKFAGHERTAKQRVTIESFVPLEEFMLHSDFICALTTFPFVHDSILSQVIPHDSDAVPLTSQYATFGDVVTYMCMIVDKIPSYHVGKENCYFFSRMLFHVVILRHYTTYHFLLTPKPMMDDKPLPLNPSPTSEVTPTSRRQRHATKKLNDPDPVWTNLMKILKEREEKEGLLFYDKLFNLSSMIYAVWLFTIPGSLTGGWFLGSYFMHFGSFVARFVGMLLGFTMHIVLLCFFVDVQPSQDISSLKEEMLRKTEDIICLHVT